jgi:hypothetical protein
MALYKPLSMLALELQDCFADNRQASGGEVKDLEYFEKVTILNLCVCDSFLPFYF